MTVPALRRARHDGARANPQIVIFSHREDEHALAVLSALSAEVRPFLLDIGRTGLDFAVTRSPDAALRLTTRGGEVVAFDGTAFWWNRRPRVPGFAGADRRFLDARESELTEFWCGALGHGLAGTWCNPSDAQRRASNKIRQFHVAQTTGMRCPDTIWSNNPHDVEAFVEKHGGRVVFKMFAGTEATWQPCRKFDRTFAGHIDHVRFMPAIYQEFLPGRGEYRVTMFGEHCFAARADMGASRFPTDVRVDLALRREAATLPPETEEKLHAFMRELGLSFATFDVREDAKGDLVFLECNPMGQFLYVDAVFGGAILKAFCGFIEDHVRHGPVASSMKPQRAAATNIDFATDIRVPIYEIADSWITHIPAD